MRSSGFRLAVMGRDSTLRGRLAQSLKSVGHELSETLNPEETLDLLGRGLFDVLIADIDGSGLDYADLLKSCKRVSRDTAIVLIGTSFEVETAFEAARLGACKCVAKPVETRKMLDVVDRALDGARLRREARSVRQIIVGYRQTDRFVVGKSDVMQKIAEIIEKVASSKASTVLIQGESGTGKELVAKAIHYEGGFKGAVRQKPFMEINCSSLPENLLESELFGYEKGAFTDARKSKSGLVELAEGGSLFLDEIGELPLNLQVKILRLIETKRFRRIGGVVDIEVSTRIIAATNRDLDLLIQQGAFRADLYYRLGVFPIRIPPLRERRGDIPLLVWFFITNLQIRLGKTIETIPARVMDALIAYDWPGNVRELRNIVERAMILSPGTRLELDDAFPGRHRTTRVSGRTSEQQSENLEDAQRYHIVRVLEECGWKVRGKDGAAERLGLKRTTLQSRMKKLGIQRPTT